MPLLYLSCLVERQGVRIPNQLPSLLFREPRPRRHPMGHVPVGQKPEQFAVARVMHPCRVEAGALASTGSVGTVTGRAAPPIDERTGGDGFTLLGIRVRSDTVPLRNILQPRSISSIRGRKSQG